MIILYLRMSEREWIDKFRAVWRFKHQPLDLNGLRSECSTDSVQIIDKRVVGLKRTEFGCCTVTNVIKCIWWRYYCIICVNSMHRFKVLNIVLY